MSKVYSSSDFVTLMGSTGTYPSARVDSSVDIAELVVENFLNSALLPTQVTEEYPWPMSHEVLQLKRARLITVDSVTALHTPDCDCAWQTTTDCAFIYNALQSIIKPVDCDGFPVCGGNACWTGCRCPSRVRIVYTYGFGSTALKSGGVMTQQGKVVGLAVALQALNAMRNELTLAAQGNQAVPSWSSAGYSESRQFAERSGAWSMMNPLCDEARAVLRDAGLIIKRHIFIRGKRGY